MKEDQNIDELFRSSFEEFGVTPPPAVKEAIDRRITASSSGKRGLFWFLVAFISLGLLATLLLWPASGVSTAKPALAQQTTASGTSGSSAATAPSSSSSSTAATSGSSSGKPAPATPGTAAGTARQTGTAAASAERTSSGTSTASDHHSASAAATHSSVSPVKAGKKTTGAAGVKKSAAQKKTTSNTTNTAASKAKKRRAKKSPGTPLKSASGTSGTSASSGNGGTAPGNSGQLPSGGALASGGTAPPTTATGGNPVVPPADSDSTKAPIPPVVGDSTKTVAATETTTDTPAFTAKKPSSTTDWWRVSLYGGPQLAFNQPRTTTDMKLTERPAFQFSAEVNRSLWNGYGFSTGIQYANRSETLNKTTTTTDSTSTWVMIPIYDQQVPDSIIGYDSVMQIQYTNTQNLHQQVNHIRSFGIPLYVTKHFEFGDNWGVLVNLGTVFQFYKVTLGSTDNIPAPVLHDFSLNVVGRVHATYRWKGGWMISAGLSGGWDLKPAAIYQGMDRKRYYLTPQVGLHYSF